PRCRCLVAGGCFAAKIRRPFERHGDGVPGNSARSLIRETRDNHRAVCRGRCKPGLLGSEWGIPTTRQSWIIAATGGGLGATSDICSGGHILPRPHSYLNTN